MTRKRTRESLTQLLSEAGPCCDGRGRVKSGATVAHEILREVGRSGANLSGDAVTVICAPGVAKVLNGAARPYVDELEKRFHKQFTVRSSTEVSPEVYRLETGPKTKTADPPSTSGAKPSSRGRRGGRGRRRASADTADDSGATDTAAAPSAGGEAADS
jgi:hypothetical protein